MSETEKNQPIVLDRPFVQKLFEALGCTTVAQWDDDVLVNRLRRVPLLITDARLGSMEFAEFAPLIRQLMDSAVPPKIIIRSSAIPTAPPTPVIEKPIRVGPRRKSKGHTLKRRERFSFRKCGIPRGATLILKRNPTITCTVIDDPWLVDFGDGDWSSFTARTKKLIGAKETTYLSPMHYWLYEGRLLRDYYEEWQAKKKRGRSSEDESENYDAPDEE